MVLAGVSSHKTHLGGLVAAKPRIPAEIKCMWGLTVALFSNPLRVILQWWAFALLAMQVVRDGS